MENEENVNVIASSGSKKRKMWPIVVLVLVILLVAGYFVFGKGKIGNLSSQVQSVATVNGVAILKSDYDTQYANAISTYKTQGVDVTSTTTLDQIKTQVLNNLINNELVNQGAIAAGIKPTDADVEKQYQTVLTQVGGAENLKTELAKVNMTDAQLRINIGKQLAAQTYLLQNIDVKSITASDAEIAQFYADYSKQQLASGQKTVPALKTLSDQIKQQIISNKEQTLITNFIATLKAKANIVTKI